MSDFVCSEGKEYNALESLDKDALEDLETMEKKLKKNAFLKGNIISLDDVEAYDNFMLLNVKLPKEKYPKILQWKSAYERMKLNWKISKKPNKGRTFTEYVKMMTDKLNEQNKVYDDKMKEISNFSSKILKHDEKEKEVTTIHFFKQKDNEFEIQILVEFLPDVPATQSQDIVSKLSIISHKHLPNKSSINTLKGEKGELSAIITSTIEKDDYDLEHLATDVKRNIQGVYNVKIKSIERSGKAK